MPASSCDVCSAERERRGQRQVQRRRSGRRSCRVEPKGCREGRPSASARTASPCRIRTSAANRCGEATAKLSGLSRPAALISISRGTNCARGAMTARGPPLRGKRSDAASEAFHGVEMRGEGRFAEIVGAAQMSRQSMIIMLFGDDPFGEKRLQRLDVSRLGRDSAQQKIRRDAMAHKEFEFGGKMAGGGAGGPALAMRRGRGPGLEPPGRRDRWGAKPL